VSEAESQAQPQPPGGALFVSYASADRGLADELSAYLEQRGIRCWMAPRDVPPGALYADAIVRAINDARALVLILSHNSTGSSHVGKELERASSKHKPIIAVRSDAAPLTPAFEYFLSESQWVDLVRESREAAFARLAGVFAGTGMPAAAMPAPAATAATVGRPASRPARPWIAWAAGVLVLAGLLVLGGVYLTRSARNAPPAPPAPPATPSAGAAPDKSIAVLPFTDMSQGHDQEFFADGMAEQILDLLAKIPNLKVIARTSSFQFKGKSEDARAVGEKLGVATLLEGSVRKAGDRLRITAQLIRTQDGSHLWSESYDREVRDVFRTQDEIAGAVVGALKVTLLGTPAAATRPAPTVNPEAYSLYLQALATSRQGYGGANSERTRETLRRALELDPNFAEAWSLLAAVYNDSMVFGPPDSFAQVNERAAAAAHRALALDPKLAAPHVTLANAFFVDYDYRTSQRELQAARALAPQSADALSVSAYLAIAACQLDDAERDARQLVERDPLSIDPYRALATALWFHGRLGEAEAEYRRVIALLPNAESMPYRLSLVLLSAGRPQDALKVLDGESSRYWQSYGKVMALDALGQSAAANTLLASVVADPLARRGASYQIAQIYAHRGDRENAFKWLQLAQQARDPGYAAYLRCDPLLASLRDDPRYQTMLAQLNLPP
jgi:TolB-like protein/Flp pilus assembly protein TadD